MEKTLEIEFKKLIDKKTYKTLIEHYKPFLIKAYNQTNYYLLHPTLTKELSSLRIRVKEDTYELTLKTKQIQGNLEYNIMIDYLNYIKVMHGQFLNNQIFDYLKSKGIDKLEVGLSLTTYRHDYKLPIGLLSIDLNTYLNITDYELELEVNNYKEGLKEYKAFLQDNNLSFSSNCPSKIKRVLTALKNTSSN